MSFNAINRNLPTEIILKISTEAARSSIQAGARLCLVSSWIRQHVLPDLYRCVSFPTRRQLRLFCRSPNVDRLATNIIRGHSSARRLIQYLFIGPEFGADVPLTLMDLFAVLICCKEDVKLYLDDSVLSDLAPDKLFNPVATPAMLAKLPSRIDVTLAGQAMVLSNSFLPHLIRRAARLRTAPEHLQYVLDMTPQVSLTHVALFLNHFSQDSVLAACALLTEHQPSLQYLVLLVKTLSLPWISPRMWTAWHNAFLGTLLIARGDKEILDLQKGWNEKKEQLSERGWMVEATSGDTVWDRAERETRVWERSRGA